MSQPEKEPDEVIEDASLVNIGSAADPLFVAAVAIETTEPTPPPSFPITRADLLGVAGDVADFVEGLLTGGGASIVYGPSNVGKSFWVLDLCAHIASGKPWRHGEIQIDKGAVVYVALEGKSGLLNRIEAMQREGILSKDAALFICWSPVSLLTPGHAAMLAQSVKEAAAQSDLPCRLVVIDTMARAMAGGNENSGEDMTAAVASIDAVKAATGAHVLAIHHSGKNEALGARGHSSLRAAVDTEIEIFRADGEDISTVRVTKQRDLECGPPMPFRLRAIELRKGRRQKPITSCIVHHEDEMMAGDKSPKGRGAKPKYKADDLLPFLPATSSGDWLARAAAELGISNGKFYELKNDLYKARKFQVEKGTGRLVRL